MSSTNTRYDRVKDEAKAATTAVSDRIRDGANTMEHEAGQMADSVMRNASDLAETVSTKLKTVGVDTDKLATAAKDQASELQRLIGDELQARPMRALGIAAAVGVVVGLMTAR